MKILLATGIFPPDIGGPATHVEKLARHFVGSNNEVRVVTYTSGVEASELEFKVTRIPRAFPRIIKGALYFLYCFFGASWADVVYAHDPTSAGLPASLAAKLRNKKFVIRIGGDVLWERVVDKGKRFVSLKEYYEKKYYEKDRPRLFKIVKKVLGRADMIIVPTEILKSIYVKHYNIDPNKITIIENPIPEIISSRKSESYKNIVLFAGRFVSYKNLIFLIEAFSKARGKTKKGELHLIGDGPDLVKIRQKINSLQAEDCIKVMQPISKEELLDKISESALGVGPALTEFNPNFILECLAYNKPVLVSRENGFSFKLPEEFLFDPKSQSELEEKLVNFLDAGKYEALAKKATEINFNNNWDNVLSRHHKIFNNLLKK